MPQSHAQVWLHAVFSTKNRMPHFADLELRDQMFRMLAFHVNETGCVVAIVGGHVDHVHLLVGLSRTLKISKLIEVIKTETSKWAKRAGENSQSFAWQSGYGVFLVSYSNLSKVEEYIRNQESHHATRSFQNEFRFV